MISKRWSQWQTVEDDRRCEPCEEMQGKIFKFWDIIFPHRPLHPYCRCLLVFMKKMEAGTLTEWGTNGADWWIANVGRLPEQYIDKQTAKLLGWNKRKGNLHEACPGMLIGGDAYYNRDGHLPTAPGRVWYEADLAYMGGFRGPQRLVYSNDGLMFATFDHYKTWVEVV